MDENTQTLFIIVGSLVGFAISLWITYAIIKAAVKAGTEEMRELLKGQIRVEKNKLKKEGLNEAEIANILTKD